MAHREELSYTFETAKASQGDHQREEYVVLRNGRDSCERKKKTIVNDKGAGFEILSDLHGRGRLKPSKIQSPKRLSGFFLSESA